MSFSVMACDHVAKLERALLLRHPGVERDLEEEVAQLVAEVVRDRPGRWRRRTS